MKQQFTLTANLKLLRYNIRFTLLPLHHNMTDKNTHLIDLFSFVVVYSISKVNKDEKLKGASYLVEGNLLIPSTASQGLLRSFALSFIHGVILCHVEWYNYIREEAMNRHKKLIILYVYDALKYGSSEKLLLHQTTIAKQISDYCGISCDRKTVARNIGYLREYGCDIVPVKGKGCYMKSYPCMGEIIHINKIR